MKPDITKTIEFSHVSLENQYLATRRILLAGEVDETSVCDARKKINMLVHVDGKTPITLEIDTYGGDVYSALSLFDVVRACPVAVSTVVVGKAMSAGFVIALAGKRRVIAANATMMYHEIKVEFDSMKLRDLKVETEECSRLQALLYGLVRKNTKLPESILKKCETSDVFFTAKECVRHGIVHKILR